MIIPTLGQARTRWVEESIRSTNVCLFDLFSLGLFVELGLTGIAIDAFLEKIRFFTTLILNADEATDI